MTPTRYSYILGILITLCCNYTQAQSYGTSASAVWISNCNQSNFYNTSGSAANLIGPSGNVFDNANLGVYTAGSGTLILRGAQVKTFKDPSTSNVCNVRMFYRAYLQSGVPGAFTSIDLPLLEDCGAGTFPSGGTCVAGDQKWQRVIADGDIAPSPIDLTNFTPGNYVLEVYYEAAGSFTSTSLCSDLVTLNNGGTNYKAFFSIQQPNLQISTNPTTCNGNEGSITLNGLAPGASYQLTYTDDGVVVGPATFVANASGTIVIPGQNAGLYSNFIFQINGCTSTLLTGTILSNPIFVATFPSIPPFCAGNTPPVLPTISSNGIPGSWNPSVVNNQTSGTYVFTPASGTCALPVTITVNVVPRVAAVFPFGTALAICSGGTVPSVLPNISTNGITGTWSPTVVSNTSTGTYTFTPTSVGCVTGTTFTVTVAPNIIPTFSFPTTASICTGGLVPNLPTTSINNITGTWSPTVVSTTTSGTYTFTPTAGQCATGFSYTVTVNPIVTPTFSFGTSTSICSGSTPPSLPTLSDNGIIGTWNPVVVSNTTSGTYTFTQTSNPCATPATFVVTVNPIVTPAFPFGTNQSVCINATAPVLPGLSTNNIMGTWSPAIVSNTISGTYTFTPTAGQCASPTTLTYQVNPIPSFVTIRGDTTVYDGDLLPPYNFSITVPGGGIRWTNSNTAIGLGASGSGTVPSFKATNMTNAPITGIITATPFVNGCDGAAQTYKITVLPRAKDIFVPNVFSPNGDTKNDVLFVYGNYIASVEMHIFNQWGEHIITLASKSQGWDGRYKGQPQPVGVYVYVLKAVMMDGTKVNKKGSITLLR